MFDSLARSWKLVQESARILGQDRELVLFPMLSTLALAAALLTFVLPLQFFGFFAKVFSGGAGAFPLGWVALFLFYFVDAAIVIFFNSALAAAVMIRLRGGDPTLSAGLAIAWSKRGAIFGYAAIAATVGLLLRAVRQRGGIAGRLLAGIGGLGWAVATYLVVPVLVIEGKSPFDAVSRSAHLLRQTWGQQLAGGIGFGIIKTLAFLPLLLVSAPLVVLAVLSGSTPLIVLAAAVVILVWVSAFVVLTTLESIYRTALYHYAANGAAPGGLDAALMRQAFQPG